MANSPDDRGSETAGKSWDISNWLAQEIAPPQSEAAPAQPPQAPSTSPPTATKPERHYPRATAQAAAVEPQAALAPGQRPKALLILVLIGLALPALFFLTAGNPPTPSAPQSTPQTTAAAQPSRAASTVQPLDKSTLATSESAALAPPAIGKKSDEKTGPAVEPVKRAQAEASSKKADAVDPASDLVIKKGLTNVNIRADPSVNQPAIAKLNGDDRVEKLLEEGPWLRIRFSVDGKPDEGWIRKDLVTLRR